MSQITSAQLSLGISSHNNRFLFSDHYLNDNLKRDPRWQEAIEQADALLPWLTELYRQEEAQLSNYNESQLEDNWFKPIFRQLGHTFEGQARIPGLGSGIKFPDYIFFRDDFARQQAAVQQKTHDYAKQALAVGEVKAWNAPLGKKQKGAPSFDNTNPSHQIDYYLRAADLLWGYLSNGRLWRLVHKESSYKLDVFFEIDLAQAIKDQNRAAMTFFVLFFSQASLFPDSSGRVFLEDALQASADYALALEKDLRDNAYKALEHLIQGFIEPQANGLTVDDLPTIYANSLYLLYRIIFLFYGEGRGLLPIENEAYQRYSITQLARDIAADLDEGKKAPPMTKQSWARLHELFTIVAGSQPDLNAYLGVPRYNGGLFTADLHPFLEQHFVGDRYLHAAIDAIARREVGDKKSEMRRENVDYRTLGVRQLGSIYEGLLEYQPQRATEPMIAVKKTKGEEWKPASAIKGRTKVLDQRDVGEIYLVTDKGERKATGSYYTPDYIVKYIVEQTLGPLVEQARERVKENGAGEAHGQTFAEEILGLDVLDPAMGSGHFLVEATDYLARAMATDMFVTVDEAQAMDDDDLVYWRRQVVEACIYGVDKNPMAVELAKLSLWLVTVAKDRPLSFLDHHLRRGDSLVGARLADLNVLPSKTKITMEQPADQPALLNETALAQDTFKAVGGMMAIETMLSDSIEDIHAKEEVLAGVRGNLDRWRLIADLWTSGCFGNDMTPEEYGDLLRYLQGEESMLSTDQRDHFLKHPSVTDNDYFHWELAFPEVFFDQHGRSLSDDAGFDAVIGNPPYVRQELLKKYKPYLELGFQSYHGVADLYLYFYEQGINLIDKGGAVAYISSGTFARANFAKSFRKWFVNNCHFSSIIDFGENQPFEGAEMVRPTIAVFQRGERKADFPSLFMDDTIILRPLDAAIENQGFLVSQSVLQRNEWVFQSKLKDSLFAKISTIGIDLAEILENGLYFGIKTGLNDAFYVDSKTRDSLLESDSRSSDLLKPMVRGADLRPWHQIDESRWLIFTRRGVNIDDYPAIRDHLAQFRNRLEPKPPKWEGKWQGRKSGSYRWFELQDPVEYHQFFGKPKIVFPKIAKLPRFSFDDRGLYVNDNGFIIPSTDMALLGVLQSRVSWFSISQLCQPLRLRAGLWQYIQFAQFINRLPIPPMSEPQRSELGTIGLSIHELAKTRSILGDQMRHRVQSDFGTEEGSLNQKLTTWWELDFRTFRAEVKKVFRRDIPLAERDDWEAFLAQKRAEHYALTAQIIALETELNERVYALFDLTVDEICIIEENTKYRYGEV